MTEASIDNPFGPNLFAGQVALINGATSGIAARAAEMMVASGLAGLAISARTEADGIAMRDRLRLASPGAQIEFVRCDYLADGQIEAQFAQVEALFGRLDIFVHTMLPGNGPQRFATMTAQDWMNTTRALFLSFIESCHYAVPLMKKNGGGSILSVISDAMKVPTPGESVIGGGMAANAQFAKVLAVEEGRNGIRVNCVSPSITTGTRAYDRVMSREFSRELFTKAVNKARLGVADAVDVAHAVAFLSSRLSSKTTGQVLSVNGGVSVA
ncbi:MAG: SDR family oxidoreductase [Sphingobium sp.]